MLSCEEMSKIDKSGKDPSWLTKLSMRFHLLLCKPCRAYRDHMDMLRTKVKQIIDEKTEANIEKIRQEEEELIKKIKS